jgi:hypothetical protein
MPYIGEFDRVKFEKLLKLVDGVEIKSAGELNYLFTELVKRYLVKHGESYQKYNDIVGALEGCKLELYRRKIAPYEDHKIHLNGDVYEETV